MKKAGAIIALISGLFGTVAAVITLFFGGFAGAVNAEGAATVVGLGWGGLLFTFLTIIFSAIALTSSRKLMGVLLLGCAIGGAVLGGTLVAICMALTFVGGVLTLLGLRNEEDNKASSHIVPIGIIVATALAITISPAHAFDSGWIRLPPDELFDYQVSQKGLRINNFNLSEGRSFLVKSLAVLKFSYSIANRQEKPVRLSVQLVGLGKEDDVVFASTSQPLFGQVGSGKTGEAKSDIYIPFGTLVKARAFLLRVTGNF